MIEKINTDGPVHTWKTFATYTIMDGSSKLWINRERRKEVKNREREEKEVGGKAGMKKIRNKTWKH